MKVRDLTDSLSAIANSSKIAGFLSGVSVELPEGVGTVTIRAKQPTRSIRPEGLKWNEFSYFTEVEASNGISATGFGEGATSLLALQKSIAEGVERVVFRSLKPTVLGSRSSNGWAAHLSAERSQASALMELLERDAALLHWLSGTPLLEIKSDQLPKNILTWTRETLSRSARFNRLRVLVSNLGHIPTVTTILLDAEGFAVFSHSTDRDFERAIDKAMAETCRIAHMAMTRKNPVSEFNGPEDHALGYASIEKIPSFIFGEAIDQKTARAMWKKKFKGFDPETIGVRFTTIKSGSLFVSRAKCEEVQDLFFGETEAAIKNGWINTRRVTEVTGLSKLNLLPHFVP